MRASGASQKDSIDAISASLEAICARLAKLRLRAAAGAASPEALAQIEVVLAAPEAHRALLARLASIAEDDGALCAALLKHAGALADRLPEDADDGYPPLGADEDSSEPGSAESSGEGPSSSSDTADADRLSDEDAEDLVQELDWGPTHAERKEIRAEIREQGAPDWFAEALAEHRAEEAAWEHWWSGSESGEDQALAREASQERATEESSRQFQLEDARRALEEEKETGSGPSPPGAAPDEDSLEELLGLAPPPAKKARLETSEMAPEAVADELAQVSARLEEIDQSDSRRKSACKGLKAALETYCELAGEDIEDYYGAQWGAAPADLSCQPGLAAAELLGQFEDDPRAVDPEAAQRAVAALRSQADALVAERPDLKRKRAEMEALDEIRAEQRSAEPLLGGASFGRLARETLQDHRDGFHIDAGAVEALQAAAEDYLVKLLSAGGRAAVHAGRTYLAPEDLQLAQDLRGDR